MPGRLQGDAHPGAEPFGSVIVDGAELREHLLGVGPGEQGKRRFVLAVALPVGVSGIFLLEVGGVGQQNSAQFDRVGGRVNRAAEPVAMESREVAAVIDVSMGEDDRVDRVGTDRERRPVGST